MELHDYEAEKSLLACVIVDPSTLLKISDRINPTDFHDQRHAKIFETILELHNEHSSIDLLVLSDRLKLHALLDVIGGVGYLAELSIAVPTGYRVEEYAKIVKNYATRRAIVETAKQIIVNADTEADVDVLLHQSENAMYEVGKATQKTAVSSLAEILESAVTNIHAAQAGEVKPAASSGYREMDQILTGFQRSDLVIVAARPSMGKTAFALNIARNVAIAQDVPTLIFSLEMSKNQLVERLLSMETGISTDNLRTGKLNREETENLVTVSSKLTTAPLYIDDTPNMTIQQLRSRAMREHHLHKLGLIVIDYLQLMSGSGKVGSQSNREQEISEISRGLKVIARELNVPVVALSQLSRLVEQRTPQIPQLSDLRESGSIEQNADIVAFLYRDDYYNQDTPRKNMTDVLIKKHRNGRLGTVELYFDRRKQRFYGVRAY